MVIIMELFHILVFAQRVSGWLLNIVILFRGCNANLGLYPKQLRWKVG